MSAAFGARQTPPIVAAIDVGSSAVRVSIAQAERSGGFMRLVHRRFVVRLGASVFAQGGDGNIDAEATAALREALTSTRLLLETYGVRHVRAVATSAMREAKNGEATAASLSEALGAPLEIISGAEEGRLSRAALISALASRGQTPPRAAAFVDLGGGSLEVEAQSGTPSVSLPFGTVRLLARFASLRRPIALPALEEIAATIAAELQQALKPAGFAVLSAPAGERALIGTGGNLEAMAQLLPRSQGTGRQIDCAGLWQLAVQLAPMSVSQRALAYGLRPDRADLMVPALLVVSALAKLADVAGIAVPGTGLRDALLAELSAAACPPVAAAAAAPEA